tara:strand:- start:223 stop:1149 length:927 start_codon:yes stop_codon:yes gene_type:complete
MISNKHNKFLVSRVVALSKALAEQGLHKEASEVASLVKKAAAWFLPFLGSKTGKIILASLGISIVSDDYNDKYNLFERLKGVNESSNPDDILEAYIEYALNDDVVIDVLADEQFPRRGTPEQKRFIAEQIRLQYNNRSKVKEDWVEHIWGKARGDSITNFDDELWYANALNRIKRLKLNYEKVQEELGKIEREIEKIQGYTLSLADKEYILALLGKGRSPGFIISGWMENPGRPKPVDWQGYSDYWEQEAQGVVEEASKAVDVQRKVRKLTQTRPPIAKDIPPAAKPKPPASRSRKVLRPEDNFIGNR